MTHHRRYQTLIATGAAVLGLFGTHTALNHLWWETALFAGVALFLVEASAREARAHQVAVRRAERLARPTTTGDPTPPVFVPCCAFWAATAGDIHTTDCHTRSNR